jgi:hypothetical protein
MRTRVDEGMRTGVKQAYLIPQSSSLSPHYSVLILESSYITHSKKRDGFIFESEGGAWGRATLLTKVQMLKEGKGLPPS